LIKLGNSSKNSDTKIGYYLQANALSCKQLGIPWMDSYTCLSDYYYTNNNTIHVSSDHSSRRNSMLFSKLSMELPANDLYNNQSVTYTRCKYFARLAYDFGGLDAGRIQCINAIINGGHQSEDVELLNKYIKNIVLRDELLAACKIKNTNIIYNILSSPELMREKTHKDELREKLREKLRK
jgi:hypothetical protein